LVESELREQHDNNQDDEGVFNQFSHS
jgi:hypothetical protein